jgi:argininosuccinate lyase
LVAALGIAATHVSRLAAEFATYASAEFGFVRLADAFCTGSSLLPQKRNPDVLELARARAARVDGDLVAMLTMLKGLPAGYAKDLQDDKRSLFDAVDAVLEVLPAVRGAVETLEAVPNRMAGALDKSLLATDLADALVRAGVPFRDAHTVVGRLVRAAEDLHVDLAATPSDMAGALHPDLPQLLASLGDWERSIESRATEGGSSRASVTRQIVALEAAFASGS